MTKNVHEKISQSTQEMILDLRDAKTGGILPYYGNMLLMINFIERTLDLPTCGVNVSERGMNFYYNPEFLDNKTQKEVNFIVIHELFHLLFNHPKRTIAGNFDHRLSNIAQDMIINHIIWEEIYHSFVEIPKDHNGKNMALFVPKEYDGPLIFEYLYHWLREEKEKYKQNKPNKPAYGKYGKYPSKSEREKDENDGIDTWSLDHIFDNIDNNEGEYMDHHMNDEIPEEIRETILNDVMQRLRNRGYESGNISTVLGKLQKKNKDYLSYIKRTLSNEIFGTIKRKTIVRPNRRGILGIKGNKKSGTSIVAVLDTSGSMNGTFEKVLSYIYRNDIEVILIEADTKINLIKKIRNKNELQNIPINGLGGTILQPAVDLIREKFNNKNIVILTDGYCDSLDMSGIKGKILMISSGNEVPITTSNGKIKQIVIEKTK